MYPGKGVIVHKEMTPIEAAHQKIARLSPGDVIQRIGKMALWIVLEFNYNKGIVHVRSIDTGSNMWMSIVEFAKFWEITIDNNGEKTIIEQWNEVRKNKNMMPVSVTAAEDLRKEIKAIVEEEYQKKLKLLEDAQPKTPKKKEKTIMDILTTKHELRWYTEERGNRRMQPTYIDHVGKTVTVVQTHDSHKKVTNGGTSWYEQTGKKGDMFILEFKNIIEECQIIGEIETEEELKNKLKVLTIREVESKEVFHAYYDSTRQDKKYIRYCAKLGRDYPQTKTYNKKVQNDLTYAKLLKWLKDALTEEEITRLKQDL